MYLKEITQVLRKSKGPYLLCYRWKMESYTTTHYFTLNTLNVQSRFQKIPVDCDEYKLQGEKRSPKILLLPFKFFVNQRVKYLL